MTRSDESRMESLPSCIDYECQWPIHSQAAWRICQTPRLPRPPRPTPDQDNREGWFSPASERQPQGGAWLAMSEKAAISHQPGLGSQPCNQRRHCPIPLPNHQEDSRQAVQSFLWKRRKSSRGAGAWFPRCHRARHRPPQ